MNQAERAILEAEVEAAEAKARALRRALNESRGDTNVREFPRSKRRPQRLAPAVVPITEIDEARARATARRLGVPLPDPARKP